LHFIDTFNHFFEDIGLIAAKTLPFLNVIDDFLSPAEFSKHMAFGASNCAAKHIFRDVLLKMLAG